jgi:glycosyltransferase involved in cell wall biosynthesis
VADVLHRRGVPRERERVVRTAVREPDFLEAGEARHRLGAPEGAFHLGWVGRFGPETGPDVFVDALAGLERRGVGSFHATMVGTGVLEDAVRERVEALGLAGRVRLPGLVHGASRLFPGFDAVVLSSRTEGTPMVLLEAMAARVPVVATRVGGIPAVVGPGEALLVPPDDPDALADALARTVSDPTAAARRAAAARTRFETELDVGGWVRAYDDVYTRAIERRGAGRDAPAAPSSVLT